MPCHPIDAGEPIITQVDRLIAGDGRVQVRPCSPRSRVNEQCRTNDTPQSVVEGPETLLLCNTRYTVYTHPATTTPSMTDRSTTVLYRPPPYAPIAFETRQDTFDNLYFRNLLAFIAILAIQQTFKLVGLCLLFIKASAIVASFQHSFQLWVV